MNDSVVVALLVSNHACMLLFVKDKQICIMHEFYRVRFIH